MKFLRIIILTNLFVVASCSGGSDGGNNPAEPDPVPNPSATTLIFPENNKECTEGFVLNGTQSAVTFQWNASQNTDSYNITVTNLNTNSSATSFSEVPEKTLTLLRGTPYEWFVISKSNGTSETAKSATFRFYNQGAGIENYAPFPANAISPKRGVTIANTTNVDLQWSGEDIDNDIENYEVLFGTDSNTLNSLGIITTNTVNVPVSSGTIYYWLVITKDNEGNTSKSEVFQFRVG